MTGHQDVVVEAAAERGLLLVEHADDSVLAVVDQHLAPDRVGEREQLLRDRVADDHDAAGGPACPSARGSGRARRSACCSAGTRACRRTIEMFGFVDSPLYSTTKPKSQISEPTRSTEPTWLADGVGVLERERRPAHGARAAGRPRRTRRPATSATWNVCAPSTLISFSMVAWTSAMAVITAMIEATPATMPTSVSTRPQLVGQDRAAATSTAVSRGRMAPPSARSLIAQRLDRDPAARRGRPAPRRRPRRPGSRPATAMTRIGSDRLAGISVALMIAVTIAASTMPIAPPEQADRATTRTGTAAGCSAAWRRSPCGCRSPACAR